MNVYRRRVWELVRQLLQPYAPVSRALDFGSGDGWFAQSFSKEGLAGEVTSVDVQRRANTVVEPQLYDGQRLPYDDRSFELVYSIDVLHHCPDPRASLRDALRCSGRFFLVKDHTYRHWWDWLILCGLDEIGNRRFGVANRYRYQHKWEWTAWIEAEGFVLDRLIHPAYCHRGLLGRTTNHLQFAALWKRANA